MNRASLEARLQKAGLARLLPYIDILLQPAIRLHTTPVKEKKLAPGVSKVGGMPDLPAGQVWPQWKKIPQSFVAQLRLSDLRDYNSDHLLPAQGMLWFFYDAQQETYGTDAKDAGAWSVIYHPDEQDLERVQAPKKLPVTARFQASATTFSRILTLAQQPQLEIPGLKWDNDDQEKYDAIVTDFYDTEDKMRPRHQLFGHPYTLQDDMRLQCQLASNDVDDIDDPRVEALTKDANAWHVLLQIDSDERARMDWASVGILYYWIKQTDLQAKVFSNTWLVLQAE